MHQLKSVLRLGKDSAVDLLDGTGKLYKCKLTTLSRQGFRLSIEECLELETSGCAVTVALPPLKSGRFEWAIEKLTELGVSKIVPLIAERSVAKIGRAGRKERAREGIPNEPASGKASRWQKIAREAAEQCERPTIPQVVKPLTLEEILSETGERMNAVKLMLSERSQAAHLKDILCNLPAPPESVLVVVGPEGGFSEREFALASESNIRFATLGKRILRSETAAICSASLIGAFWNT